MERHTINYGEKEIIFELERKNVKNINLNIRPDMSIMVSANENVPLDIIKNFVQDKASWIRKNTDYFKSFQPLDQSEREYISGESFKYLGRQYRLRIRESDQEVVKYFRGFIYIYVKDKDDYQTKKDLFKAWLYEKSHIHFNESLDRMYELARAYNIAKPHIHIREMRARWGSCHREEKKILLNSDLIKAPKHCIDYVVLHELIHFKYKNHDNRFYVLLTFLMPDWQRRKRILDEELAPELRRGKRI